MVLCCNLTYTSGLGRLTLSSGDSQINLDMGHPIHRVLSPCITFYFFGHSPFLLIDLTLACLGKAAHYVT